MGQLYENYEILRQIGTGGFSRVYKAVPKDLSLQKLAEGFDKESDFTVDELVAVKVVRTRPFDSELKRVADNEIEILNAISSLKRNKNQLVQLIDVYLEPRRAALIMEYLDGGELFARIIQRTKYSEQDAAATIKVIVEALNAIHSIDIVHRDIKPENLVYKYNSKQLSSKGDSYVDDSKDLLKLMDFGLSIDLNGDDPHEGALYVGTPGYIAPEVISKGVYSPKSDIFSLGVILFILLSGRMPFSGKTSAVINTKILQGKIKFRPSNWQGISAEAKDLVLNMLKVDPDERISGNEILKHSFVRTAGRPFKKWVNSLKGIKANYEKSKFGERIRQVLTDVGTNLKTNLDTLLKKRVPKGFSVEDVKRIKEGFTMDNSLNNNCRISREVFIQTMQEIGFNDLPLEQIFDAILDDNSTESVGGNPRDTFQVVSNEDKRKSLLGRVKGTLATTRRSVTRLSFKRRNRKTGVQVVDAEEEVYEKDTISLNDLLIGLSIVARMNTTEEYVQFLYEIFSTNETGPRNENGLTENEFKNVAKVMGTRNALGEKDNENDSKSRRRRKKMAAELALLFSSSISIDEEVAQEALQRSGRRREEPVNTQAEQVKPNKGVFIQIEELQNSINKFGTDLLETYLKPGLRKLDKTGKYLFGEVANGEGNRNNNIEQEGIPDLD